MAFVSFSSRRQFSPHCDTSCTCFYIIALHYLCVNVHVSVVIRPLLLMLVSFCHAIVNEIVWRKRQQAESYFISRQILIITDDSYTAHSSKNIKMTELKSIVLSFILYSLITAKPVLASASCLMYQNKTVLNCGDLML